MTPIRGFFEEFLKETKIATISTVEEQEPKPISL